MYYCNLPFDLSGSVMTENLKFEMFIKNLNIRYHGIKARGLSPLTLRDFTHFRRNRVCEASKVCLLKLLRYSPFNPRRNPPNTWFNKNSYRRHAYNGSTPIYFYIRFWNPQRDSAGLWRRWKRLCGVERLNRDGEAQSSVSKRHM